MIRPCTEHRGCLGEQAWDEAFDDGGPGCGQPNHNPACLCDVKLRGD